MATEQNFISIFKAAKAMAATLDSRKFPPEPDGFDYDDEDRRFFWGEIDYQSDLIRACRAGDLVARAEFNFSPVNPDRIPKDETDASLLAIKKVDFVAWAEKYGIDTSHEGFTERINQTSEIKHSHQTEDGASDDNEILAALFDPVKPAQLEAMFTDGGKWAGYAERAKRWGLKDAAKAGHGRFNPFKAARWWIDATGPDGWTWARCLRVLANNLPARSMDSKQLLTGDYD